MQKVELNCPVCGQTVAVTAGEGGPSGTCPGCSTRIEVPPAPFAVLAARSTGPPPPVRPALSREDDEDVPVLVEVEMEEPEPEPPRLAAPPLPPVLQQVEPEPTQPAPPSPPQNREQPPPSPEPAIELRGEEEQPPPRRQGPARGPAGGRRRDRVKGETSLDLFDATTDPAHRVLSEYWQAQGRPRPRGHKAFIIYLCLLGVLALLLVLALVKVL
jgi:hypothetical protein